MLEKHYEVVYASLLTGDFVGLFGRKPLKRLEVTILTNRALWETLNNIQEPYRSNGLSSAPASLRKDYLEAREADPAKAEAAMEEARRNPPSSAPREMSWDELLDQALR